MTQDPKAKRRTGTRRTDASTTRDALSHAERKGPSKKQGSSRQASSQKSARYDKKGAKGTQPSAALKKTAGGKVGNDRSRGKKPASPLRRAKRLARRAARSGKARRVAKGVAALVVVAVVIRVVIALLPITVTVNGQELSLAGFSKSATAAVRKAEINVTPGDLVDVEGGVLEEGKGYAFTLVVNGEDEEDLGRRLKSGDVIEVTDGEDITEDYTVDDSETIPFEHIEQGTGAIGIVWQRGADGLRETRTGAVSGKTATVDVREPIDQVYLHYNPDVGDDKVIALTFDDGPHATQTDEILDILAEYDAKATFFVIGQQIAGDQCTAAILREKAEGHQICTHTWDHAAGSGKGVSLGYMTADEQRDEVSLGIEAITGATGDAVHIMRAPGGNFPLSVWENVEDLIDVQIGWNIDTRDWSRPGVDAIVEQIESAQPGDIILMHDGGGDRSQTIEALKTALPYLVDQGYTFITIDELLKYPPQGAEE